MIEILSYFVGNATFAQALHDVDGNSHHVLMEVLACIDGIFSFAPALLHCILTQSETTQSLMMKTGNDVLTKTLLDLFCCTVTEL